MNQFKKAKEKALESGHKIESATVLQSAGKTNDEEEKKSEISDEIIVKEIPVEIKPVEIKAEEIKPEVKEIIKEELKKEIEVSKQEPERNNVISVEVPIIKEVKDIKEETKQEIKKEEIREQVKEDNKEEIIQEVKVPVRESQKEVIETQLEVEIPAEPVKVTKKSIPNIFAPKDEAKSMRKSLVLKPTSVKKAENYCLKNGGSFNELVQTLLDNFINDYGL